MFRERFGGKSTEINCFARFSLTNLLNLGAKFCACKNKEGKLATNATEIHNSKSIARA